jgi:Notch-like protein
MNFVKTVTARNCSDDNVHCLNVEGTIICDNQATADAFNKYFLSITDNIVSDRNMISINTGKNNNNPVNYLFQAYKHPFPKNKINYSTTKKIKEIIKSLKTKNTYGYDEISVKVVKASSLFISASLNYICNKILSTGTFLASLKYSEIIPLFKKGDKNNTYNYRPISLLPSFSKVFEKIIYVRLYYY